MSHKSILQMQVDEGIKEIKKDAEVKKLGITEKMSEEFGQNKCENGKFMMKEMSENL